MEVARAESFTSAAARLGMSRANVTKQIMALETSLDVRLLNRSRQFVVLTEAGALLFERGAELLQNYEAIEDELANRTNEPRGVLHVGAPSYYGTHHLVGAVVEFQRLHKNISVALHLDIGDQNLIKDGLDLSIRIASSFKDSAEISRLLVRSPQVLVASRDYLDRRGRPQSPEDLAAHSCLVHTIKSPDGVWQVRGVDGVKSIKVSGGLTANFGEALKQAALLGEGISMHPTYMVADEVRADLLEVVLPGWEAIGVELYAIYPHRENLPLRVRLFIDFLRSYVATDPKYRRANGDVADV